MSLLSNLGSKFGITGSGGLFSNYMRLSGGLVDGLLGTNFVGDYDASKNFDLQKANLEYQKWVQQQTWNREDNAVQRRVKDLQAVGQNPLLASGAAAQSGAVVSTTAPQRVTQKYDPIAAISARTGIEKTIAETEVATQTAANLQAQNANLTAQNMLIAAQVYKTYIDAGFTRTQAAANLAKLFGTKTTSAGVGKNIIQDVRPNLTPEQLNNIINTLPDLNGRNPY